MGGGLTAACFFPRACLNGFYLNLRTTGTTCGTCFGELQNHLLEGGVLVFKVGRGFGVWGLGFRVQTVGFRV